MEHAQPGYRPNFDSKPVTPFAALVEVLHPGAGGRTIVKLLDGRAERTRVLHWKAGRRGTPQWAIDLLRRKLAERHAQELEVDAIAAAAPPRPGLRAGAKNLAAYNARRNKP
jgi:hypothetical protein